MLTQSKALYPLSLDFLLRKMGTIGAHGSVRSERATIGLAQSKQAVGVRHLSFFFFFFLLSPLGESGIRSRVTV